MYTGLGINAALTLVSHLVFIVISFRLLFALRFDRLLKAHHERDGQLLMMFIAVGLGYLVSSFFLSIVAAAQNLPYLIK